MKFIKYLKNKKYVEGRSLILSVINGHFQKENDGFSGSFIDLFFLTPPPPPFFPPPPPPFLKELKEKIDNEPLLCHFYDRNNQGIMFDRDETGEILALHEDTSPLYEEIVTDINLSESPTAQLFILKSKTKVNFNPQQSQKQWMGSPLPNLPSFPGSERPLFVRIMNRQKSNAKH
ncbi:hypothetical protein ACKWTF_015460 [Chironomus riparius]